MKKAFSFITIMLFIDAISLFGGGRKESPMLPLVEKWTDSLMSLVFWLIAILCVVGLIKFITTRRK